MITPPKWVDSTPEEDRLKAIVAFKLNYAALQHNRAASIAQLSTAICGSDKYLYQGRTTWTEIPAKICVAIEEVLGRDVCPREFLNPEIFTIKV